MLVEDLPNRQELSEITAATLDGADCFILSHETSMGNHPIKSTVSLAKAIAEAEAVFDYDQAYTNNREELKKNCH
jgi:pyruvate kinase